MAATPIVAFYRNVGRDHRGRSLTSLREQTLPELERTHDYIQWLFPLPESSSASADAPILSDDDILAFRQSPHLREQLGRSLLTMLIFYGLESSGPASSPTVVRGPTFPDRATVWLTTSNHNHLRLTRILRCLTVLGCRERACALLTCLEGIYADYGDVIGVRTVRHWRHAVDGGPSPWRG